MNRRWSALAIVGILGGEIPLRAQTPPPLPVFDDSILVTATVAGEKKEEVPASFTVVEEAEIVARQVTSVEEILRTAPGLALTQGGSAGHAVSLFSRGTESNHTLVLWNGVPLNDPFLGGFDWAFLASEGVDRIEVLRGPFSALYGSSALGGVVQIFSAPQPGVSVRVEGGEDGYRRAALAAGRDFGALHVDVFGHLRRGDGAVRNDFFDSDEATARATWNLGGDANVGLLTRYSASEVGIPTDGSAATPHRRQSLTERQVAVPFQAEHEGWSVQALLSQTSSTLGYRDPDSIFSASDTETEARRLRTAVTYRWGDGLSLAGGGEFQRQEVSNATNFGENLRGAARSDWAVFGELRAATARWALDLGVRRDEDQFYGGQASPKAGLLLHLGRHGSVHASYGEGFRAPSFLELFYPFSGNPNLQPEKSRSYELGGRYEEGAWRFALTAFENQLRDLIDFNSVTFQSFNVRRARTRGVEAEIAYAQREFRITGNATYLEAENLATGQPLLRRPRQSANLLLSWSPPRFTWSGVLRFVGRRLDYPAVSLPSYTVAEVAATWRLSNNVEPYARVLNFLDRRYQEAAGYPAPRRTLVGGVALKF